MNILLLGYGGANNTGAEIRILTIIDDVRAVFGPDATITVVSADAARSTAVIGPRANLVVQQVPHLFVPAIWRLAGRNDLLLLVEGSTFKQNWSSALLWLFLWGAWSARRQGKRCIAYAVDAGALGRINGALTRHVCAGMDLIVTRTDAARDVLATLGIRSQIHVTADTAFQFEIAPAPRIGRGSFGLAPVEFNEWPVRMRLWGRKATLYHWPFYHAWNAARAAASGRLVAAWVVTAQHAIANGWPVALIAMEELDQRICDRIYAGLEAAEQDRVVKIYAGVMRPQEIVSTLRALGCLITSRYHALVLSMKAAVPVGALYHDERLISILRELGLERFAIDYRSPGFIPDLRTAMPALLDAVVAGIDGQRARIAERHDAYYAPRARANRDLLAAHGGVALSASRARAGGPRRIAAS